MHLKYRVWLFSCEGANGSRNSVAGQIARRVIGGAVIALTCNLSYTYSYSYNANGMYGYTARPARGKSGRWISFQYRYERGVRKYYEQYF